MKQAFSKEEETQSPQVCSLCKLSDDCVNKYGEKITLQQHNLSVHYFCLLTSSGVYQRGEEEEGVYGFLVEDINTEIKRSSKLRCTVCKKRGASVGCNVKSCRKTVHFPCGLKDEFIFQFTGLFPSYCKEHRPAQTQPAPGPSAPLSCSVCLEPVQPVLSYSVLKCPCCHSSWFHRDCIQHQAQSAGMFFFRCTICNNKEKFQQEMLHMGIYIPERDASWELEENAYEELLDVYQKCDALKCHCYKGRKFSAQQGKWEILCCKFCGSSGTHRQCASLQQWESRWVCEDCGPAVNSKAVQRRNIMSPAGRRCSGSKRQSSGLLCPVSCKRTLQTDSAADVLLQLASQISPHQSTPVLVGKAGALKAALKAFHQRGFEPCHSLAVKFTAEDHRKAEGAAVSLRRFLRLMVVDLHNSHLFEGPENEKNLVLDVQAMREDLYYDAGCMLAISLVNGGPPLGFFSKALYKCLFNYPQDSPLSVEDMGDTVFANKVKRIKNAETLQQLKKEMKSASVYLELAGCLRRVSSLSEKHLLVQDIVNFHLLTRMQLPLQRFREGLKTLGVLEHIQMFPRIFFEVFCSPTERLSASMMLKLFSVQFSTGEEINYSEAATLDYWTQYLHDCEEGRCANSLEDVLIFATSTDAVPAVGFTPAPSLSFIHPPSSVGAFPSRKPSLNHLSLPVVPSYEAFKKNMEYAICQLIMMQTV